MCLFVNISQRSINLPYKHIIQHMKKRLLLSILTLCAALNSMAQFVTIWKTDNPGTSNSNQITIPATGNNYTINWVEVGNAANNGTEIGNGIHTLTFPSAGTYQVNITKGNGTFTSIRFNNSTDRRKLLQITQWGDTPWTSMENAYDGCTNLTITATDIPNLQNVTSMAVMFARCSSLATIPRLDEWNVSNVTNMYGVFSQTTVFNETIEHWNVGNVTDMGSMFQSAGSFNQPIGGWNVSKVTNMSGMFNNARAFNQTIENWDVSKVTSMLQMFTDATTFNQPIGNWDVGNVINTGDMFNNATAFNQPIGDWDVSNVTNMNGMFANATAFNKPITDWDVSNATTMRGMFNNATAFNQPIGNWDVSKVSNMREMFYSATSFNQPIGTLAVENATNMSSMFQEATSSPSLFNTWDLGSVTNMTNMFSFSGMDCANLTHTLVGWADNTNTPNNIDFGATGLSYGNPAVAALETLRTTKNWTISIGNEVACAILDVTLIRFLAQHESGKVNLQWATASETDHDYFEVQRSADARQWAALTKVKGAGTVTTVQQYATTDLNPLTGTSYYRLKIVDLAGKAAYSHIQSVYRATPQTQYIYPNPAYTTITLTGTAQGTLRIYNILGREVIQKSISSEKTEIDIQKLPAGIYTIKMNNGWNTRFVKQ